MERLQRNPTLGLRSATVKANSPGYVTEVEFERFCLTVAENAGEHYAARDVALLVVMFNCGLRISEALSLDLAQVDLDDLRFHGVMRKGRFREDVVMNRSVADALRRWFLHRSSYKNAGESPAVFLSDRGRRLSARAVQRSFRRYVGLAGLSDRRLTPHSLRHSCATALIRRGVGIETVANVLAHRRLDTTRLYLHLGSQEKRNAVALLDAAGAGKKKRAKRGNFGLTRPIPQSKLSTDSARKAYSADFSSRMIEVSSSDAGS
jgi:site-specific recombinase XerD